eukprot:COSAG02_NODE_437_length_22340_cov_46.269952_19_plen_121_part_00
MELWEYPPRSACLTYVDAGEISVQNGKVVADATSNASHVTEPNCQPLQQATCDNGLWRWESEDGLPYAMEQQIIEIKIAIEQLRAVGITEEERRLAPLGGPWRHQGAVWRRLWRFPLLSG